MGAYKYLEELWKKKQSDVMNFILRLRSWEYRQLSSTHRCTRPSRPDKARRMGFKNKQGIAIFRTRVRKGGRKRQNSKGIVYGKPSNQGINKIKKMRALRTIAEDRVGRIAGNLRVLNSYWVGQDGTFKYFEVIMVDPAHKAIRRDARFNWICAGNKKHRESRGTTSIGKKSRGLRMKGFRSNQRRPSRRANEKRRRNLSLKRFR
jgi:large subunit ribosomal protein L15e